MTDYDPGNYDALLVVSFGGPEGMDDVIPFLENVLRGREPLRYGDRRTGSTKEARPPPDR
jgi:hypothetical protein